ncbi:MAG: Maf family nucleotide pyrophosphatase [Alistipes sp.]|jgi:septum formation protein|nr:Maf family nucleotide pyrophosphatase [Alistipes sp.]
MTLPGDKLRGRRLILASASPRRRQILAGAELPFTLAAPYDVDEVWPEGMPAAEVAEYLAGVKSDAYPSPLGPEDILLTADTTVILDGTVLGKPRDGDDAREMLAALSGRTHTVTTGVVLRTPESRRSFTATTAVHFRRLTAGEIDHYVASARPMDKAGAYAIQEWIGHVGIERIDGSFYNVMGLPIQMIYDHLDRSGIGER